MAANKSQDGEGSLQKQAASSAILPDPIVAVAADQSQDQQIKELKELTVALMSAVKDMQTQNAQNVVFQDAIADVKSAARAMMVSPPATASAAFVDAHGVRQDCDCDSCVSAQCCCFEIVLDKIRGIQPQGLLEIADIGDTTIPIPTINELEVRLFASIDNIGILLPSLSTTMGIRVPSVLAGGGPGLWQPIGAVIGRVTVPKGTLQTVTVEFQGSEIDEGVERLLGFKDEHGAASGTITLDCCSAKIYPPMPTDLSFDHGGSGGGQPGAISIAFFARRVCC